MTLIEQIQKHVLKLSPDKQSEVLDFVAFLQLRSSKPSEPVTDVKQGERIKDLLNQLAKKKTFSEFFRASPLAGIDLTRDKSMVHLTIRAVKAKAKKKKSALKVIESLKVDAPADWSENIETNLHVKGPCLCCVTRG